MCVASSETDLAFDSISSRLLNFLLDSLLSVLLIGKWLSNGLSLQPVATCVHVM
jgi:hypothetical protein